MQKTLSEYAKKIILLPPFSALPTPVASHPDMLLWCYDKKIVTWEDYAKEQPEIFSELESAGYEIITADERASDKYPLDVPLNCAVLGKRIIANTKTVSNKIKKIAQDERLQMIHTNQGYAKCSTCIVSDSAIITADASIHTAAKNTGIDSLLISPLGVSLDGYDRGFIGGATGSDDTHVFFCGDLNRHPDGERIVAFCERHEKKAISLSEEPLYDYGTIIFLN
jgi:hypothetical protein